MAYVVSPRVQQPPDQGKARADSDDYININLVLTYTYSKTNAAISTCGNTFTSIKVLCPLLGTSCITQMYGIIEDEDGADYGVI